MATLEDIIANAVDYSDRPDLLPQCRKHARVALCELHALTDFHRDLITADSVAGELQNTIALPANFRKLRDIFASDSDGNILDVSYARKTAEPMYDNWGFVRRGFMYYIAGGNLVLQHEEGQVPDIVAYSYYSFPTVTTESDSTVTSTSWMLEVAEGLVLNKFMRFIAVRAGNTAGIAVADADINQSLSILLASDMDGI